MWQLIFGFVSGVIVGAFWAYKPPPDPPGDGTTQESYY